MLATSLDSFSYFEDMMRKAGYSEQDYSYYGLKQIWDVLQDEDADDCDQITIIEPQHINDGWSEYTSVEQLYDPQYKTIEDLKEANLDVYELENGSFLIRDY